MLVIEVGAAAPGGYVRAVFSRRVGGFAAPLDLMRAQLKAAARLALRARMRAAFAGYMVSDDDDEALRRLETYGRKYEAKAAPFSERRGWHSGFNDSLCMTGTDWPMDSRFRILDGGPLDAPGCLQGGACDSIGALFGGSPQIVALRETVEIEPAFSERRGHWLGFVDRSARYWPTGAHITRSEARDGLRAGFWSDSLDAVEFFPGGGARWQRNGRDGFVGVVSAMREGLWE